MSDRQKLLKRRRRKRNMLKCFYAVILAPARLPRISLTMVYSLMKVCEVSGVAFVVAVIACMVNSCTFTSLMATCMGIAFFGSMLAIRLQSYQDVLKEHGYMN